MTQLKQLFHRSLLWYLSEVISMSSYERIEGRKGKNWSNCNVHGNSVRIRVSLDYAASMVNRDAVLELQIQKYISTNGKILNNISIQQKMTHFLSR